MLSDESLKAARDYISLPCDGFPSCDGDLPGEPHEDSCPAKRRGSWPKEVTIRSLLDSIDELKSGVK